MIHKLVTGRQTGLQLVFSLQTIHSWLFVALDYNTKSQYCLLNLFFCIYFIIKKIFIWNSYLAPALICLQSPDILVAILHSWVYLWRNQGNKKLYLPLSGADLQKLHSIIRSETLWTGSSRLLAGFSSYIRLLKRLIPCHCALHIITADFWEGTISHELVRLMEGRKNEAWGC